MTEQEKIAHVSKQLEKLDREGEAYIKALTASLGSLPVPNIQDDTAQITPVPGAKIACKSL